MISIPNERPLGSITCQPSENKSLFSETHHSEMEVAIKGNSGFPCSPSSLKYERLCEGSGELQALQGGWEVHKKRQGCEERTGFGGCPHGGRNSSRSTKSQWWVNTGNLLWWQLQGWGKAACLTQEPASSRSDAEPKTWIEEVLKKHPAAQQELHVMGQLRVTPWSCSVCH